MAVLELGPEDALYYEWQPPVQDGAPSFAFVNPITGDVSMWNDRIVPALSEAGYGTLVYNFRGQARSPCKAGTALDDKLIVTDLMALLEAVQPTRPVLAGLSIGGLYAARAVLDGATAAGLVLINTLRRITPRIAWMNDVGVRVMELGGPNLMKDLYFHLLVGEPYQAAHRAEFLADEPDYQPLPRDTGLYSLLTWMGHADWDVDWSGLALPTLVITGTQDRVFYDPAVVDELFAQLPQGRRLDVAQAGHMLPIETPDPLIAALLEFGQTL
ncbi:MAG: alpha/beta hydrolase [Gammaproteobacteria bacterium]|nr:alpha/beta hydrolase [Gammaproteobacteria bacterium]